MEYKICLGCRAQSFRYFNLTVELKNRIKELLDNGEDLDVFWMNYVREAEEYCEETEEYFVDDRFVLTVEDEDGNEVYSTEDLEDIKVDDCCCIEPQLEKGYYFTRLSTWKQAEWTFTLDVDEFDPDKLRFIKCNYNSYPFGEDTRLISSLYYDDEPIEEVEMTGFFDEQYWNTAVLYYDEDGNHEDVTDELDEVDDSDLQE